ncbi:MAG: hypothetical protein KKB82_02290 [Candidatus Omnitrophica bacterium]|nr:hypothetical protein [Candidatus Omnitrophota bacterium]MBU1924736.1 hypothetical protein [Candidatus Omnitrophota bacterium]MBU2063344.1 hypothetical protein [Candidatus Omnitrophota bacterium]
MLEIVTVFVVICYEKDSGNGAAGFIGNALCRQLAANYEIVGLDTVAFEDKAPDYCPGIDRYC